MDSQAALYSVEEARKSAQHEPHGFVRADQVRPAALGEGGGAVGVSLALLSPSMWPCWSTRAGRRRDVEPATRRAEMGGIHWDESRQRFIASVTTGLHSGRQSGSCVVGSGKTEAQARAKLKDVLRDHEDGFGGRSP